MDEECNNAITREADALIGSHEGASSEGKASEKRQDTADI